MAFMEFFGVGGNPANQLPTNPMQVGWKCPVCGLGNAPFATSCGHCRRSGVTAEPTGNQGITPKWRREAFAGDPKP